MPFLALIVALLVTMVLIPPLMRVATRLHAMDVPDARKVHDAPIPRVGGIAIIAGAVIPILVWAPMDVRTASLLVAIAILLVFGILDDVLNLHYRWKFGGQILAAFVVVVYGDVEIQRLTFDDVWVLPPTASIPLTMFFLVGVTNAINLADGLDGLAGGTTLLSVGAIAVLGYMASDATLVIISLAVIGSILGFLRFNTHPARLFMGDTGSQFLGFVTGALAIVLTQRSNLALSPILPVMLMGLAILDTLAVMAQRVIEERSPFSPDKNHIHHKLLALGFDHYEAVSLIYLIMIAFVSCAFMLRYESDLLILGIYGLFCAVILAFFRVTKAVNWCVRRGAHENGSFLSRRVEQLRLTGWLREMPIAFVSAAIPTMLVSGAILADRISMDFAIASLAFVALGLPLVWARASWATLAMRGVIYIACAFVVYLAQMSIGILDRYDYVIDALFILLAVVIAVGIRFSGRDAFQVTPLDLLVIALAVLVPSLMEMRFLNLNVREMVLQLIVLFYGSELVISRMSRPANLVSLSTISAFLVIGWRGLLVQ